MHIFASEMFRTFGTLLIDIVDPVDSMTEVAQDNESRNAEVQLATLQLERNCELDERIRQILQEIRDLQRDITAQAKNEKLTLLSKKLTNCPIF